jgi:hypothetical protein
MPPPFLYISGQIKKKPMSDYDTCFFLTKYHCKGLFFYALNLKKHSKQRKSYILHIFLTTGERAFGFSLGISLGFSLGFSSDQWSHELKLWFRVSAPTNSGFSSPGAAAHDATTTAVLLARPPASLPYIYIYIYTYVYTCIHAYVYKHTYIHTYMHT